MRKAARLFEIIQMLRQATQPLTAEKMAGQLEVTVRSVYRDIVALQAMRVPIEGARGLGYMLRSGFTMPPLMLTVEETEAIILALAMLERAGDTGLKLAAQKARQKVAAVVPAPLRDAFYGNSLHAWGSGIETPDGIDLSLLRQSIRDEQVLKIWYRDEMGRATERAIWPIALIFYTTYANLVAWCELRQDLRQFRTDRIEVCERADRGFKGNGDRLRRQWIAGWDDKPAGTAS